MIINGFVKVILKLKVNLYLKKTRYIYLMIELKDIKIDNDNHICFICLHNDYTLHDFPCKNCKLKIHLKCFHDYINKFENSKICSVCKKDVILDQSLLKYNNDDLDIDNDDYSIESDTDSDDSDDIQYNTIYNRVKFKIKIILNKFLNYMKKFIYFILILFLGNFIGYIFFSTFNIPFYIIKDNSYNSLLINLINFILIGSIFSFFILLILVLIYKMESIH